jgi:hypothetical protein
MSEMKDWGRKKAGSIRELALNLSFELGSLSEDLMQKARYSSTGYQKNSIDTER